MTNENISNIVMILEIQARTVLRRALRKINGSIEFG